MGFALALSLAPHNFYILMLLCMPLSINIIVYWAGIMALCATSSSYDVNEIATRILPNVVVLTIDPDRLSVLLVC